MGSKPGLTPNCQILADRFRLSRPFIKRRYNSAARKRDKDFEMSSE